MTTLQYLRGPLAVTDPLLKTSDIDHKISWNQITEEINQVRRKVIFS